MTVVTVQILLLVLDYCVKYWHTIQGKTDGIKNVAQVLKAARYLRANAREFGFPDHLPIDVIIDVTGVGTSTRDLLRLQERRRRKHKGYRKQVILGWRRSV